MIIFAYFLSAFQATYMLKIIYNSPEEEFQAYLYKQNDKHKILKYHKIVLEYLERNIVSIAVFSGYLAK